MYYCLVVAARSGRKLEFRDIVLESWALCAVGTFQPVT